jgi:membrane protease YdiL (CAAX protease family)
MHILAGLFVLLALIFAFSVISGMLFVHRERIGAALAGHPAGSNINVIFVSFTKPATATQPELPLAA